MAIGDTTFERRALSGANLQYRVCLEVLAQKYNDPNSEHWCDFNKRKSTTMVQYDWFKNRLAEGHEPTITLGSETQPETFSYSASDILLDNRDGMFCKPCDASNPWQMVSVDGVRCHLKGWYRKSFRVRLEYDDHGVTTYIALGVFVIDDISRDRPLARMKVADPSVLLKDVKAKDVRRGDSWMKNVPLRLLMEQVLVQATKNRATLSPDVSTEMQFSTATEPAISPLGNVPLENSDGIWNESRDFVTNYVHYHYNAVSGYHRLYFAGYNPVSNRPKVVLWNMNPQGSEAVWSSYEFPAGGNHEGWEMAFCWYMETNDRLQLVSVSNQARTSLAIPTGFTGQFRAGRAIDHGCRLHRSNGLLTAGISSAGSMPPVWRMGQVMLRGKWATIPGHEYVSMWAKASGQLQLNMPVPYDQCISSPWGDDAFPGTGVYWAQKDDLDDDGPLPIADVDTEPASSDIGQGQFQTPITHGKGYAGMFCSSDSGYIPDRMPTAHTMLTTGFHESFQWVESHGRLYWIAAYTYYVGGAAYPNDYKAEWFLCYYQPSGATGGTIGYHKLEFNDGATVEHLYYTLFKNQITGFRIHALTATTGLVYVATCYQDCVDIADTAHIIKSRLYRFALATATPTVTAPTELSLNMGTDLTCSLSRRYAPILVSLRLTYQYTAASPQFVAVNGVVANLYACTGHSYGLWYYGEAIPSGSYIRHGLFNWENAGFHYTGPISTMPFELSEIRGRGTGSDYGYLYVQDQASGTLWVLLSYATGLLKPQGPASYGDPVDQENTFSSSNLVWDDHSARLVGVAVSSPPAHTQERWRTVNRWGGNVPQLGIYTPLGRLTMWQLSTLLSDTVGLGDFGDTDCYDALKQCRMFAGDYVLGWEPDVNAAKQFQLTLAPRSTETPAETMVRAQVSASPLAVGARFRCEGLRTKLDHSNLANSIIVPVYLSERSTPEVEIVLKEAIEGVPGVTIYAQQHSSQSQRVILRAVRTGAPIADPDTFMSSFPIVFSWSRHYADVTTILAASAAPSATTITVRGLYYDQEAKVRLGDTQLRVGDFCTVEGGSVVKISALYPATMQVVLESAIGGATTHPIGASVVFSPAYGERFGDSIDGICEVATAFSVPLYSSVFRDLYVNDTRWLAPGTLLWSDTGEVLVRQVYDDTHVQVQGNPLSNRQGKSTSWAVGTKLKGGILVRTPGRSSVVPGAGVSFSIMPRESDVHGVGLFRVGDVVRISCGGLTLKELDNWVLRARDEESIALYGVKDWKPRQACRLMTPNRARYYLDQMPQLGRPKWDTSSTKSPLLPTLVPGYTLNVLDEELWPYEDAWLGVDGSATVKHVVRQVAFNLKAKTMDLALRSFRTGEGDREAEEPAPMVYQIEDLDDLDRGM